MLLVAEGDGSRGGDARADREDQLAHFCGPLAGNGGILGARTDQAHLAHQHVPELRQFVDLGIAQEFTQGGYARISFGGDFAAPVAVLILEHRTEFQNTKGFAVTPGAKPTEEDGPGGVTLDADGNIQKERTEDKETEDGDENVHRSAGDPLEHF